MTNVADTYFKKNGIIGTRVTPMQMQLYLYTQVQ